MYVSAPHLSVSLPLSRRIKKKCRALNFGISLLHLQRHISTQDAVNGAGIKIGTRRSLNSEVKRKRKKCKRGKLKLGAHMGNVHHLLLEVI